MWINEIGHNPATSIEVDEDNVAYFNEDIVVDLLDKKVNYYLEHNLDNAEKYLNDLDALIESYRTIVKVTKDKLRTITDDEITAIVSRLDAAFNLTWVIEDEDANSIQFRTSFENIDLTIYHFYNSGKFILYISLLSVGEIEHTLDDYTSTYLDEVINYISTFFLRLKDSVNYLEVNNAAIHTIAD
jgi:hypothetical protein